jgi:hypothetical protein
MANENDFMSDADFTAVAERIRAGQPLGRQPLPPSLHLGGLDIIVGYRKTLRLTCPGQRWIALPSHPMTPEGLLIWNAPPGATVSAWVCGSPLAGSNEGMSARQFDPAGPFERLNKLIEWPTIDASTGVELEVRTRLGQLIIADNENAELEIVLYGLQVRR